MYQGWEYSSVRVPASKAQGPEIKPQYHQKRKKSVIEVSDLLYITIPGLACHYSKLELSFTIQETRIYSGRKSIETFLSQGMLVQACNLSTKEVEAGGSRV